MKPGNAARVALALALAAGLLLAFANREALTGDALSRWLAGAGVWAPLAFIALYAVATVLFLPGSVLTLAAGALFGPVLGTLYSLTGATLGAMLAFLVARYLAADWAARLLRQPGFTDVRVLRGGMEQWNRKGFAIARESSL